MKRIIGTNQRKQTGQKYPLLIDQLSDCSLRWHPPHSADAVRQEYTTLAPSKATQFSASQTPKSFHALIERLGKRAGGLVLNPMIVNGQQHGGVAQGIGQALYEHAVYDRSTAQLVTGSFMDYAMPRADMVPNFEIALEEVRCKTNPIGVKGIGESGTIGAPPVVINAIVDALGPLGIDRIDMPATPSRVWQAIESAKGTAELPWGQSEH